MVRGSQLIVWTQHIHLQWWRIFGCGKRHMRNTECYGTQTVESNSCSGYLAGIMVGVFAYSTHLFYPSSKTAGGKRAKRKHLGRENNKSRKSTEAEKSWACSQLSHVHKHWIHSLKANWKRLVKSYFRSDNEGLEYQAKVLYFLGYVKPWMVERGGWSWASRQLIWQQWRK